jgi:hypothetical protein
MPRGAALDLHGTPVSEEEVAKHLGFKDVNDLRRWQTEVGHENRELKFKLKQEQDESRRFQWHGRRDVRILEKCDEVLKDLQEGKQPTPEHLEKLRLAISVVKGGGVDWKHVLEDWLGDIKPGPSPWVSESPETSKEEHKEDMDPSKTPPSL